MKYCNISIKIMIMHQRALIQRSVCYICIIHMQKIDTTQVVGFYHNLSNLCNGSDLLDQKSIQYYGIFFFVAIIGVKIWYLKLLAFYFPISEKRETENVVGYKIRTHSKHQIALPLLADRHNSKNLFLGYAWEPDQFRSSCACQEINCIDFHLFLFFKYTPIAIMSWPLASNN